MSIEELDRATAVAEAVAAVALKKATEYAGKYSWTSTDQRAAAIHGFMQVYAAMIAKT